MTTLPDVTAEGAAVLLDHSKDYVAARPWADEPLESADVGALTQRILELVEARHLLLPDADALVERIVVALLGGHVVLSGPPGTGKTTLARLIADAFDCSVTMETATADWSAYDVVGGLRPQLIGEGDLAQEVLTPWLGHVTRAAVECADTIAQHDRNADKQPHQAHWLVIDELSRAEIDKAVGPLYTALGGSENRIPLWFADAPERNEVWIPKRFRIVATMNSVDTAYVFSFSQGLTRRFQFITVGVPEEEQLDEEMTTAAIQAGEWFAATYGGMNEPEDVAAAGRSFSESDAVKNEVIPPLQDFVRFIRYPEEAAQRPGWPIGTAQIVDVMRQVRLRYGAEEAGLPAEALDRAVADRVVPQMSGLLSTQLDALEDFLGADHAVQLPRTMRALQQLRQSQNTQFA